MTFIYVRIAAVLALLAGLIFGWFELTSHYESVGYERRKVEDETAMLAQEEANRALQRAAELRYTVQGEIRDRFITKTITEVRHETQSLAACVLTPAAAVRLRDAAACASGDSPAACGPGEPLR